MLTNLSLHLLQKVLQGFTTEINQTRTIETPNPRSKSSTFEHVQSILETAQTCTNVDPDLIAIYPQLADLARACAKSMIDNSYPISCIQRIYSFVEHFEGRGFDFRRPVPNVENLGSQCAQPRNTSYSLFSSDQINPVTQSLFPIPIPTPTPVTSTPTPATPTPATPTPTEDKPTIFSFRIDSNITKDKINKIFSEALKINQVIDHVLTQVESTFSKDTVAQPETEQKYENYDLISSYSESTSESFDSDSESGSSNSYDSNSNESDLEDQPDQTGCESNQETEQNETDILDELKTLISDSCEQDFEENDFDSEVPLLHTKRIPKNSQPGQKVPDPKVPSSDSETQQPLSFNRLFDTFLKTTLSTLSNPESQNLPKLLKTNLQDVCELVGKNSQHSSEFLQKILKEFEKF